MVALAIVCGKARSDVLTGLEGYWPFDGDAQDYSGNGRNGTLVGDAHFVSNGVFAEALELDGDGDFVSMDGYKGILQSPWTLACWVKTTEAGDLDILSWGTEGGGLKVEFRFNAGLLRIEHGNGNIRGDVAANDGVWHHAVAQLPEGGVMKDVLFYLDGEQLGIFQIGNGDNPFITTEGLDFNVGRSGPRGDRHYIGQIDEVRIYSRLLSQEDIREMMETSAAGMNPLASGPSPADGTRHEDTWVNLGWKPGGFAVSHDVYLSDNYDDVNNGTGDAFRGNQTSTSFIAGFPGFTYPDGLVPGTTYYWRIDEVNESEPNSPWKGDIWSFVVPSQKAYDSYPADGADYVDTGVILSWEAGMNAKLHHVYFGDNFDDVNVATGALGQTRATYNPGPLELQKTYYWRVDEFDGTVIYKGDVWNFTTMPEIETTDPNLLAWFKLDEIGGATAVDWSGRGSHGILRGTAQWIVPGVTGDAALTFGQNGYVAIKELNYTGSAYSQATICGWVRTTNPGTQIIASFGRADYWRLGIDSFGAGPGLIDWDVMTNSGQIDHGSLTRVDDGTWHHVCCVFDSGRMTVYIDGLADSTTNGGATFGSGQTRYGFLGADSLATSFDGARDRFAALVGDIDDLRIYDRVLTPEEIVLTMRGDPLMAWNPNPSDGSMPDIINSLPLTWSSGDMASQHNIYFGTDRDAVKNADTSDTSGIYRGAQSGNSYTPNEGIEWGGGPYYWRIDEKNTDGTTTKGQVWSFAVADFILVDGFESYNDIDPPDPASNRIFETWIDGFGTTNNGALVGNDFPPYTERNIVHSGRQSMPYLYDNNLKTSEATLTLVSPRDWTAEGVTNLSLWFIGDAANTSERMFVALNGSAVVYHTDSAVTQTSGWTEWVIELQRFADQGVNLTNVNTITIGFGTKNSPAAGGSGQMYFDDIRLYR